MVGGFVVAILITGFVAVPISSPQGAVSLEMNSATPMAPLPPGSAVATNISLTVNNQDPVVHGFLIDANVTNVTVLSGNGTAGLTGSALAAWEATANWTFFLPDGRVVELSGGSVFVPSNDYLTVNATGSHSAIVLVHLSNSQPALGVGLTFITNMVCPPQTGGTATTRVTTSFV